MSSAAAAFLARSREAWKYSLFFFFLQVVDLATTMYILNRGGVEHNPVMAKAFSSLGLVNSLVIKVALATSVFCVGMTVRPRLKWKAIAFYVVVVAWNIFNIAFFS